MTKLRNKAILTPSTPVPPPNSAIEILAASPFPRRRESTIMPDMSDDASSPPIPSSTSRTVVVLALAGIVVLGAYLRIDALGARSLWLDEFCTWHVSRMELGESLRWEPELTIPPLYQLTLRALSASSHPPEWLLRLPAAGCGILTILAAFWLGKELCSIIAGCALAALVACNALQLDFSQEARSYTMLVLGCTVSFTLWYRLITRARGVDLWGYVVVTTLTFYGHFLVVLTILAQLGWWVLVRFREARIDAPSSAPLIEGGQRGGTPNPDPEMGGLRKQEPLTPRSLRPLWALLITVLLCAPLIVRSIYFRETTTQAIAWVDPWSWKRIGGMLADLTYGPLWVALLLALAVIVVLAAAKGWRIPGQAERIADRLADQNRPRVLSLLLLWMTCAWLGLLIISLIAVPMTITRYALPAAIPALLLPLVLADRLHRRAPLVIAVVFLLGTAPDWLTRTWNIEPGFRELTKYVREHVDPEDEAVILAIAPSSAPHWARMRRLALQYYPLEDRPIYEVQPDADGFVPAGSMFEDPRPLYLIVFRMDPFPMILQAGRRPAAILQEGVSYSQVLFSPYRLVKVAPIDGP